MSCENSVLILTADVKKLQRTGRYLTYQKYLRLCKPFASSAPSLRPLRLNTYDIYYQYFAGDNLYLNTINPLIFSHLILAGKWK